MTCTVQRVAWLLVAMAMLSALAGCQHAPAGPRISDIGPHEWKPMESVEFHIQMQKLGEVPNSGLLLPAVSPDGKWVACIRTPLTAGLDLRDLASGEGCQDNSLLLRATDGGELKAVCDAGVSWVCWSGDSRVLAFLARGESGRGELGVYDVASSATHRLAVGMKRVAMSAVSPAGDKVALVDADSLPMSSRVYVLEMSGGKLQPGPALEEGSRQLWPMWADNNTIVFLDWGKQKTRLCRWTVSSQLVRPLRQFRQPADLEQAMQLFVAVPYPLCADGELVAYYDSSLDRIVSADLAGGQPRWQPQGTRAGCWMGKALLSATDKDLYLSGDGAAGKADRMLKGQWLPIWADPKSGDIILIGPGADERSFAVSRLRLLGRN